MLQPNGEIKPEPMMDVKHVADAIVNIANLPNSVTVDEFRILYVSAFIIKCRAYT